MWPGATSEIAPRSREIPRQEQLGIVEIPGKSSRCVEATTNDRLRPVGHRLGSRRSDGDVAVELLAYIDLAGSRGTLVATDGAAATFQSERASSACIHAVMPATPR